MAWPPRKSSANSVSTTRVLILTTFDVDEYVYQALQAEASGFLLKDTRPTNLIQAIEIIAAGEALLAPNDAPPHRSVRPATRRPDASGSGRAHRARARRAPGRRQGWSNVEIAASLYVSPATIKTHISRLLMKLAARDRAQLIVIAYETGLVAAQPKPP